MRVTIFAGACIAIAACAHPRSAARPASAPPDALGITEKLAIEDACGSGWARLTDDNAKAVVGGRDRTTSPVATTERPTEDVIISHVAIAGVAPALATTLEAALATRPGMTFGAAPLKEDLARLLAMGAGEDASIEAEVDPTPPIEVRGKGERALTPQTATVTFRLAPPPTIGAIEIHGEREALRRFSLLRGAAFEPHRLWRMATSVAQAYVRDGHLDATVTVAHARRGSSVDLCVVAKPGPRVTIAAITFPGRHQLPEAALRGVMHTEKVNHPGALFDQDVLDVDALYLSALYWDHGFANVKVGSPRMVRRGARLTIEMPITEGGLFTFGVLRLPRGLRAPITVKSGDMFSRTAIMNAKEAIEKELGVDVYPTSHVDLDHSRIDITFEPQWRWPWQGLARAFSR